MKTLILLSLLLCYVFAQNILTGAYLMGFGFDYWKGGLVPPNITKGPIFKFTIDPNRKWSPPGRKDLVFLIPREFTLIPNATHHEQTSSDIYYSYSETVKVSIKGFSFSIGIDLGKFGFGAEYGREYGRIRELLNEKFKASSKTHYTTSTYALMEIPYPFLQLDDSFQMVLDMIPDTPQSQDDLRKVKLFFDYYGGWFAWKGNFGGRIDLYTFLDKTLSESRNVTWLKEQFKFNFHFYMWGLSAGGFYNRSELEKKISKEFREHSQTEMFFYGGIRQYQNKDKLKEWDRSIDDSAGMLEASFRPISDIIQENPVKQKNLEWMIKSYSETGVLKVPPSVMKVNGLSKIPGYMVVGCGFDPVYMQPRLQIFDHENGFANPTVWKNPFYPQYQFAVPSTLRVVDNTNSVEKNFTDYSLSKNEYEAKYFQKRTKKYFFGMGKRTTIIYHYYYRFEMQQQYKLDMERMLTWYDINLKPHLLFNPDQYVTPAFKAIMDQIGTNCNDPYTKRLYRLLVDYYGTHLITGVTMGGSAHQEVFFNKTLLQTHQISQIIRQSGFSFLGLIKFKKYDFKKDQNIEKWFKDNADVKFRFIGGRYRGDDDAYTEKEPWQEFVESLRTDPGVIQYDILPLSSLFRDQQKAACMERVANEYIQEMASNTVYKF